MEVTAGKRSDIEIVEAATALKKEIICGKLSPMKIHYIVALDALMKLLSVRKQTK